MQAYIGHVPPSYHRYIRQLTITTSPKDQPAFAPFRAGHGRTVSDTLIQLLSQCTQLEQLTLNLDGSLCKTVVPCFESLHCLSKLSINHVGDEQHSPL